jgi:hypothetical protein
MEFLAGLHGGSLSGKKPKKKKQGKKFGGTGSKKILQI